ncbi:emp24/gp25L/p24 family protein [Tieghemostelium lacteum]|uniref:Emp24/gp25L/p24 family protein n=1 Tax=Tieghemostelium lacteum TaxID=361077 RepID=A0A152AAK2_TIELA|nr:emp24/gp25L/p24 family protein [Tieghemostelium lacteum]|eukprot:KYR03165.1 emp24/gp25L/p24 family protein [Tieghemostelium lacteum]
MNIKVIGLIFTILCCIEFGRGIYFELNGGQTKCFLEENPKDTLLLGKYQLEDLNPPTGQPNQLALSVRVTDPEKKELLSKTMGTIGRFSFTTQIGGEHKICFSTNTSRWFGPSVKTRLHLDLETGAGANDYEDIAKVEQLNSMEISIRRLNDRVNQIRKEQSYQRGREQTFRNTSESTNSRVMWWSLLQVVVLVATGVWQMRHLKSFFKAKKLV